jgi:tRNA wybutosine-synthesizing protein 1
MSKLKGKTRTVVRINLVKDLNMDDKMIKEYSELIKKANPVFIEIKGYMAVGFARQRLGYERMPWHEDIKDFSKKLVNELNKLKLKYKFLDEQEYSRVVLLGKSKKEMKIRKI